MDRLEVKCVRGLPGTRKPAAIMAISAGRHNVPQFPAFAPVIAAALGVSCASHPCLRCLPQRRRGFDAQRWNDRDGRRMARLLAAAGGGAALVSPASRQRAGHPGLSLACQAEGSSQSVPSCAGRRSWWSCRRRPLRRQRPWRQRPCESRPERLAGQQDILSPGVTCFTLWAAISRVLRRGKLFLPSGPTSFASAFAHAAAHDQSYRRSGLSVARSLARTETCRISAHGTERRRFAPPLGMSRHRSSPSSTRVARGRHLG
jgi:hypothetical protein